MPDDSKPTKVTLQRLQEGQQYRSQQSGSKALIGGASETNPFTSPIIVIADTPQAPAPPSASSSSTSDSATPATPTTTAKE